MTANPWTTKVHITRFTYLDDAHTHAFASVAVGNADAPSLTVHGVRAVKTGPRGLPGDVQVLMPVRAVDKFKYGLEVNDARLRAAIVEAVRSAWEEAA